MKESGTSLNVKDLKIIGRNGEIKKTVMEYGNLVKIVSKKSDFCYLPNDIINKLGGADKIRKGRFVFGTVPGSTDGSFLAILAPAAVEGFILCTPHVRKVTGKWYVRGHHRRRKSATARFGLKPGWYDWKITTVNGESGVKFPAIACTPASESPIL